MKSRICRIWQNELYRIRSVLVFGGMGTAAPAVGTLVNRGGYNPEVRVRGGYVAVPRGCAAFFSLLLLLCCVLLLHSVLVLLCVVVLASGFLVALHLHFS